MLTTSSGHGMSIGQWDGSNHRIEGDANRPVVITSYNSGGIKMGVSGANKVAITSDGLTFNGDTAAANALSDYEEGTFTVSLGGSWNSNPTNLAGAYVKIGRMVHIYVNFAGGSKSSTTSGYLQGLPFATTNYGTGSVVDSNVDNQGNCLFFNTNIIWLTDNSFNSTTYVTGQYTTDD